MELVPELAELIHQFMEDTFENGTQNKVFNNFQQGLEKYLFKRVSQYNIEKAKSEMAKAREIFDYPGLDKFAPPEELDGDGEILENSSPETKRKRIQLGGRKTKSAAIYKLNSFKKAKIHKV
jgi:hypothetical protein